MLRLYSGSGSQEIELIQLVHQSDILVRSAIRFLSDSGEVAAAKILHSHPFELWSGTNGFSDEFEILYLRAKTKTYMEFEQQAERRNLDVYESIAHVFEKLNRPVRFITVDVDLEEDVEAVSAPSLTITSAVVERA